MTRTWEISDLNGRNKRTVTLAEYRAEIDAAVAKVRPVIDAFKRGDIVAMEAAQKAIR